MTSIFLPPSQSRLVTICAHVDHGKTTLADNLIESNGIISERLAGTLRYLDSLEEEQRRGITIRTSAIGLKHQYVNIKGKNSTVEDVIIHLLDSPGHSDFSTEVSSSLLACDGCLLVVDAVEGICARTHQVIREAHIHQLVPILVINKIDRLCTDLCLTPTEAYLRLRTLIESINATCAAMIVSKQAANNTNTTGDETTTTTTRKQQSSTTKTNGSEEDVEEDDETIRWTFEPHKGNVIFASALFGWGFTIPNLTKSLFRNKILDIKPMILKQYLFGDFKYNSESGKVLKWKVDATSTTIDIPPMFAEYALQPIWTIYEGVAAAATSCGQTSQLFATSNGGVSVDASDSNGNSNKKKEQKIKATSAGMDQVLYAMQQGSTNSRNISSSSGNNNQPNHLSLPTNIDTMQQILTQIGASTEEPVLRSLLRRYRPLSDTVLDSIYEQIPSPKESASSVRTKALTAFATPPSGHGSSSGSSEFERIQQAVQTCQYTSDVPVVAQVCKFMAADRSHIRDTELDTILPPEESSSPTSIIMGLTRVLSGRLTTGQDYFVLGPKATVRSEAESSPNDGGGGNLPPKRKIRLYLLMGSSFVKVDQVPAGHLCAIQNLEDLQLKTATLCDSPYGRPLLGLMDQGVLVRPLVKVNVESVDAAETMILERGLRKLSLADGAVEVTSTSKGERILACLGELHLEQSILDLKNIYCERPIELRISDPIVEFGETTDWFASTSTTSATPTSSSENTDYHAFWNECIKDPTPLRQATIPPYNEEEGLEYAHRGRVRVILSGRVAAISLRVIPLSANVFSSLDQGHVVEGADQDLLQIAKALGIFQREPAANGVSVESPASYVNDAETILKVLRESLCALDGNGNNAIVESPSFDQGSTVRGIVSDRGEIFIPPSRQDQEAKQEEKMDVAHANAEDQGELAGKDDYESVREQIRQLGFGLSSTVNGSNEMIAKDARLADSVALRIWKNTLRGSVTAGFQHTMRAGPICEELVRGVMVVLEGVEIAVSPVGGSSDEYQCTKPLNGGMVVAALRSGIRSGLLTRPARLMESHLRLTLHSSLAGLGPLYQVLSKRRGKVLEDSMVDGTDLLLITATLPHAESFGLAPELFRKSSGEVTAPELEFSHWDRFDEDPFWIPTTLEEREDFGEILQNGDVSTGMDNTALNYIRKVRERKGLLVDSSRTVIAAEKQRTLKR